MAKEPKTRPTDASVEAFIDAVEDPRRREDAHAILALMRRVTNEEPVMWGPSIVGFGSYRAADGKGAAWCRLGFSPRKANLVVYLIDGYENRAAMLARLGKHKIGKSCLYLNKLADIDPKVLEDLVIDSWTEMARRYPC
jgi:hypothetical protein